VCHFEAQYDWWVSKHLKKHKSTVLTLAWHPNSHLLATGSSDFRCRIFSAFIRHDEVDGDAQDKGPFAEPAPFGEVLAEFTASGWVHAVAWAPSGEGLAFAGHDATLHFVSLREGAAHETHVIRLRTLPLSCLMCVRVRVLSPRLALTPPRFLGSSPNTG